MDADHLRLRGTERGDKEGGTTRNGTMQKENTIARWNGGMHFLLVGARQSCRCPTALESFQGGIYTGWPLKN